MKRTRTRTRTRISPTLDSFVTGAYKEYRHLVHPPTCSNFSAYCRATLTYFIELTQHLSSDLPRFLTFANTSTGPSLFDTDTDTSPLAYADTDFVLQYNTGKVLCSWMTPKSVVCHTVYLEERQSAFLQDWATSSGLTVGRTLSLLCFWFTIFSSVKDVHTWPLFNEVFPITGYITHNA